MATMTPYNYQMMGAYDQKDAAGFIKLNALRLRLKSL